MDATNKEDTQKDSLTMESNVQIEGVPAAVETTDTKFYVKQEETTCAEEAKVDAQHNQNKDGVKVEGSDHTGSVSAAVGTTDTKFYVKQEETTCAEEAKVDAQHNQNKDGVKVEGSDHTGGVPAAVGTTDTNRNVEQEENTTAKKAKVDVTAHPAEVAQPNQVVKVDALFKNTIQNMFSNQVAAVATGARLMTYGVLREGMVRGGERVLLDYTAPSLIHKKRLFRSSGHQHEHLFESSDGEDITSYAVIAQDVDNECVTADVLDGGVGSKLIKLRVTSHKEGSWRYRVVVCGKQAR